MQTCGGVEVELSIHTFLISALDGKTHGTHRRGDWVSPRAGLDAVAKRKNLAFRESNPGHPASSLVTILTDLS
jgi:hypothetical protein